MSNGDSNDLPENIISSTKSLVEIENQSKIISGFLFEVRKNGEDYYHFFITLKENITKEMIEKKNM